jgi:membrane protein implicated in regulation of membrane protease activity
MQFLVNSLQLMVFISLALASFVFLTGSLLFGGGHDHDHDHGHDHGGVSHDFTTISFFSPKVISIFLLAFGATGAISSVYGRGPLFSTVVGIVGGLVVASVAYWALHIFYAQQVNSLPMNSQIVGAIGTVVTRISPRDVGEVSLVVASQRVTRLARSANGDEIPAGRSVSVKSVAGDALLVEPVQQ